MDDFGHGDRGGGSLHAPATLTEDGFMTKEQVADLATAVGGGSGFSVAGTGLTASGSTVNVIANADGSIVANANDVQVGVLATDAQHGNRGGGALHADATNASDGFATAAQITALEGAVSDIAQLETDLSTLDTAVDGRLDALEAIDHAAVTLAAVGASPNANGATLTAQALNLELASASHPGLMTAAQFSKLAGVATAAPKGTLMFGTNASTTVGTAAWLWPFAKSTNINTTLESRQCTWLVPFPLKVTEMHCWHATNGAGTGGANVTLRKNLADTAMTFNHANGAGSYDSTSANQQTFAAGDRLSVSFITVATLSSAFEGVTVTVVFEAV